jgi:hypothetical protein
MERAWQNTPCAVSALPACTWSYPRLEPFNSGTRVRRAYGEDPASMHRRGFRARTGFVLAQQEGQCNQSNRHP